MFKGIVNRAWRETAASSIREITAHMFDHFLTGILTLMSTHKLNFETLIQTLLIIGTVVILIYVVRNQDVKIEQDIEKDLEHHDKHI